MAEQESGDKNVLRKTFIGMLFALVVAKLAGNFAEWFYVATSGWTVLPFEGKWFNRGGINWEMTLPLTHNFLSLALVSMSWLMWSRSQAGGHQKQIQSFVSYPFLLLLIEVFLVTLYFSLASVSEQDIDGYLRTESVSDFVKRGSARPEAIIFSFVFLTFFIWDIIADVLDSPRSMEGRKSTSRLVQFSQGVITYCSISALCAMGAYLVAVSTPVDAHPRSVIMGDMALFLVLIWFRSGKLLEPILIKIFPKEAFRSNTVREMPGSIPEIASLALPLLAYFILLRTI